MKLSKIINNFFAVFQKFFLLCRIIPTKPHYDEMLYLSSQQNNVTAQFFLNFKTDKLLK